MGVCQSIETREQLEKNRNIERNLELEKKQKQIKLLLLGTAECGKSTVLKQMRILHDNGFSEQEMQKNRSTVYLNIIDGMNLMLTAMEERGVILSKKDSKNASALIQDAGGSKKDMDVMELEIVDALKILWSDDGIQEIFTQRSAYHLADSAKYFLDELDRISVMGYIPTSQDMLFLRVPTNGIVEVKFELKGFLFRVFDVGGQRSERKKWIHCFDDVTSILFVCAISEFDLKLQEDGHTNRLVESLALFKQVVNNEWFTTVKAMILFMNKTDLFLEKLKTKSIAIALPEYKGSQEYEEAVAYIEAEFRCRINDPTKTLYPHETCATDSNQVQLVLDGTIDTILAQNLSASGIL